MYHTSILVSVFLSCGHRRRNSRKSPAGRLLTWNSKRFRLALYLNHRVNEPKNSQTEKCYFKNPKPAENIIISCQRYFCKYKFLYYVRKTDNNSESEHCLICVVYLFMYYYYYYTKISCEIDLWRGTVNWQINVTSKPQGKWAQEFSLN